MHKPSWFQDGKVLVSTARTCGINKDGHELYTIDHATGTRTTTIDDQLASDVEAILSGSQVDSVASVDLDDIEKNKIAVPVYYDTRYRAEVTAKVSELLSDFTTATIGELIKAKKLEAKAGHGSPSADVRTGTYPYIKVSDLRAGQVNINPTNMVSAVVAEKYWKGKKSGLEPFDLVSPSRASKNIGDFCVLMPGQEQVVLTKEVIVLRPGPKADFDSFYLLWALSLQFVHDQWNRVVFFQTNREDVGKRYADLTLPVPPSRSRADEVSQLFRDYYTTIAAARSDLARELADAGIYHFHVSAPAHEEAAATSCGS